MQTTLFVIGCLAIIKGIFLIALPHQAAQILDSYKPHLRLWGFIAIAIGAVLAWVALPF